MKAAGGSHTYVPTSPAGPSRLVTVSEDGDTLIDGGVAFTYNATADRYQARVPPGSDPPGLWHFITLTANDGYSTYEMTDQGHTLPTEFGKDYANG